MIPLIIHHVTPFYHPLDPLGEIPRRYLFDESPGLLLQSLLAVREHDGSLLCPAQVHICSIAGLPSAGGRHVRYGKLYTHTLGFIVRNCITVINAVVLPHIESDLLTTVCPHSENISLDSLDLSHRSVEDTEPLVIGCEDDAVSGGKSAFFLHILLAVMGCDPKIPSILYFAFAAVFIPNNLVVLFAVCIAGNEKKLFPVIFQRRLCHKVSDSHHAIELIPNLMIVPSALQYLIGLEGIALDGLAHSLQ